MHKILLVVRHEIVTTLQKRSFWVMTILFPAIILVFNVGTQILARNSFSQEDVQGILAGAVDQNETIAYVDESGLIKDRPAELPAAMLHTFTDEAENRAALAAGDYD